MRLQILIICALALIAVCCPDTALARGGKGGGKGGGGRPNFAGGKGGGGPKFNQAKGGGQHATTSPGKEHKERKDKLADRGGFEGSGVLGNPTRASVAYGKKGLELKIDRAVQRVREMIGKS